MALELQSPWKEFLADIDSALPHPSLFTASADSLPVFAMDCPGLRET